MSNSDLSSDVSTPSSSGGSRPQLAADQAGGHPCQGIYWTAKGQRPRAALITHYNVDSTEHYIAPFFARRGFGFLGWNTRYRGAEDQFILEHALIDIGVGVRWLSEEAGVERVVILGNSGGGSLMVSLSGQSRALPGRRRAGRGRRALASLPGADLYVSLNAHQGRPEVLTDWMDPSVTDEFDPTRTDPALDPFNPDNGPPYPAEFSARYRAAQRERNQRITDWAKAELARVNAAGVLEHPVPALPHLGRPALHGPAVDPSDRPLPGLLPRLPAGREQVPRHRPRRSAPHLAVDVEPGDLEMPGQPSWPRSIFRRWWCRAPPTSTISQRRARRVRGAGVVRQGVGARSRRTLPRFEVNRRRWST